MKKTFNININGIIFHIDEDAYIRLNSYLENLKSHFKNTDGRDEIINDIESRIAEILEQKISEKKQVVNLEDVNAMMKIMGQPNEFSEDIEEDIPRANNRSAHHYNTSKRLFRNPDNKMIGGVASGIAAYFSIDEVWVRLLFVATLIAGGFGLYVYLILWAVVPEAASTAERLQMRGEAVNIDNIEKTIKDEFEDLKSRFNDFSNKTKDGFKKKRDGSTTIFENIFGLLFEIIKIFGKALLIIIGLVVIVTALALIIPFMASLFGWSSPLFIDNGELLSISMSHFSNVILNSGNGLFITGIVLFIGIPLLGLLYLGIRLIFRIPRTRYIGASAFSLWIISLILMAYFALKVYGQMKYDATFTQESSYEIGSGDTLNISLTNNFENYENPDNYFFDIDNNRMLVLEDDLGILISPELDIRPQHESQLIIKENRYSRGKSPRIARELASNQDYNYNLTGNNLVFDKYVNLKEKFRGQELQIKIKIPIGTIVYIDKSLEDILNWWHYYDSGDMGGSYWLMTEDGLKRLSKRETLKLSYIEKTMPAFAGVVPSFKIYTVGQKVCNLIHACFQ
jgi:phage shock protein PspC (stress-responsive transcriptional regulator)